MIALLIFTIAANIDSVEKDNTEEIPHQEEQMTAEKADEELEPIIQNAKIVANNTKKAIKYFSKKMKKGFDTLANMTKQNAPEFYEKVSQTAQKVGEAAEKVKSNPKFQEVVKQASETLEKAKNAIDDVMENQAVKGAINKTKDASKKAAGYVVKKAKEIGKEIEQEDLNETKNEL